jgi:hypothetical protein
VVVDLGQVIASKNQLLGPDSRFAHGGMTAMRWRI